MKFSLGISDFLEEIASLSHSIVFLCFFALITEEGFFTSPCYFFCERKKRPKFEIKVLISFNIEYFLINVIKSYNGNVSRNIYLSHSDTLTFRKHRASFVAQLVKNPPAMWET